MNYTSAAIGVIALVGVVTWVTTASKMFTGPVEVNGVSEIAISELKGGTEGRHSGHGFALNSDKAKAEPGVR